MEIQADGASPKQPPDAPFPEPRPLRIVEPRPLRIVEPRAVAGAGEPLAGAGAGEPHAKVGGVEPRATAGAGEPRAMEPRAEADAVESRVREQLVGADGVEPCDGERQAGEPHAMESRAAADVVEPHAGAQLVGAGGVEPCDRERHAMPGGMEPCAEEPLAGVGGVEPCNGEPRAAADAVHDLQYNAQNAKLWNALDADFAAAMDVELAIPLNTVEPEVQFLPCLMPATSTQRPADPSWVPPEGMDPLSTYLLEIRVMRKGNREDYSLPIDADTTNYKDFLDDIAEKYALPLDDIETIQYNDGRKKHSICRDQDLTAMFDCFEPTKKGRVTIIMKDMAKFLKRKRVANKLQGHIILPSVMKELHAKSRNLDFDLERNDDCEAEVTERGPNGKRHIVDLEQRTCTCREWQVSGKPCAHALCFLSAIRFKLEPYVHDCYSVSKFKAAYAPRIPALTDISQWPKNTHDFYLHPPILKRSPGRPSTERVKSAAEGKPKGRKGRHQCPICKGYGHSWKKCKEADPEAKEAYATQPKKRPKKKAISTSTQAIDVVSATTSDQLVATSAATTHGSALQLVAPGGASTVIVEAATPPAKRRERSKRQYVPASPDSPSMGTRSKKRLASPDSPSMGTRSKKRLAV